MSEMSKTARAALKAKAHRLANEKTGTVDASSYGPEEDMHAGAKTGMKLVSRAKYRDGGSVMGDAAKPNGGRTPRKNGGSIADAIANTDQKEANQSREGYKFDGGLKTGGRTKRSTGGTIAAAGLGGLGGLAAHELLKRKPRASGGSVSGAARDGMRPVGGRIARAMGGSSFGDDDDDQGYFSGAPSSAPDKHIIRAIKSHGMDHEYINGVLHGIDGEEAVPIGNSVSKLKNFLGYKRGGAVSARPARKRGGKVDVNIVIATGKPEAAVPENMEGASPLRPPPVLPAPMPAGPPPAGLGAAGPPGPPMMPPPGMPPMPRKRGGRTKYHGGAGGGLGRLEKIGVTKYDP